MQQKKDENVYYCVAFETNLFQSSIKIDFSPFFLKLYRDPGFWREGWGRPDGSKLTMLLVVEAIYSC